ncbi:hypothetical protein L596_021514 [Steinernema carpocapsae]|uniref:F-box associated domain-containing protein n=1 Tax=Steinernema carpocapsae TaxID=34508 RepID=A0A4U5MIY5_STECR|nr:hypothetical protein L596_021514 [Steinernema carpocapsae]
MADVPYYFCYDTLACLSHTPEAPTWQPSTPSATEASNPILLPGEWFNAAKRFTDTVILKAKLAKHTDNEWHYSISKLDDDNDTYTLDRLLTMNMDKYRFLEITVGCTSMDAVHGEHIDEAPWTQLIYSDPVVSTKDLNQTLVPLIIAQLADPAKLDIYGCDDFDVASRFASLQHVKKLHLNYEPGLELILKQKVAQNDLRLLNVSGSWPHECLVDFETTARSKNLMELQLHQLPWLVSPEVVKGFVDRWKEADGKVKMLLTGKPYFEPEEVKVLFDTCEVEGEKRSKVYTMEAKTGQHLLSIQFKNSGFMMLSVCLSDCGC